jgi:hypothetical protein
MEKQHEKLQIVGRNQPVCGEPVQTHRLKARHVTQITRREVLGLFMALGSSEEVGTRLGIPARTVTDILILDAIQRPSHSARPFLVRRAA